MIESIGITRTGNYSVLIGGTEYTFAVDANGYGVYGICFPNSEFFEFINKGRAKKLYAKVKEEFKQLVSEKYKISYL